MYGNCPIFSPAPALPFTENLPPRMYQIHTMEINNIYNEGISQESGETAMPPSKKMIPSMILDILKRRTDENHTLDQKDILDELNREFDPPLDRKTVRRNIEYLLDIGCPIVYTEKPRSNGNDIWTDFYLARDFTEAELRLLIDGLLFSNHVPYKRCQDLIEKLEGLASEHFRSHVKHIKTLPDPEVYNKQLFFTIQVLDEAISRERQVAFHYVNYGTDKKNHPRLGDDGKPKEYIINPYQMVAKEGKYYLICNNDDYGILSNYRVDRIADIRILEDKKRKPFSKLKDANGDRFNLSEYMKTHIKMYASGDCRVRFKINPAMVTDIIDIFGKDVTFEEETGKYVIVSAKVTENAMIQFAKSYSPDVVILEPQHLVDTMKDWARKVNRLYK